MNEAAIKDFVAKTHEKYAAVLQEEFGKSIPAIFTDEPHISGLSLSEDVKGNESISLPFTEKLPGLYREKCGLDFFQAIPDMIWNRKGREISDFRYIEDHFARVNYCLTRGKPMVHVGIIHPIETMWLYRGADNRSRGRKEQLETDFRNITEWLLTNGIDFDYIAESLLEEWFPVDGEDRFMCGEMEYAVILVPDCINLRRNTLERLKKFQGNGGRVFLCGEVPRFVDCVEEECVKQFTAECEWIPVAENALLDALEPWRELDIQGSDGNRRNFYLHQFRQEKDGRWLFMAQA